MPSSTPLEEVYGGDRRMRLRLEEHEVTHALAAKRSEPLWAMTGQGPAQVAAAASRLASTSSSPRRSALARDPTRFSRRTPLGRRSVRLESRRVHC
jgi:hypothetical protein